MPRRRLPCWRSASPPVRKDLRDVSLGTLEFIRTNMVGEKGVFHLYEDRTGRRYGEGQLDANAWATLAFLEGYRVARVDATVRPPSRSWAPRCGAL